ncbi:efflux RND transporter periplasmic adaptor subunit [Ancylobacter sp. 6x-1]|uniref:Efflux RND transporter periplasmic adaptor subunit n=1 Tax=Ancylobacter crimeensis TaxID=2579147 RepID=A0ABT0DB21_9HYPH|nr:efflux RND transporter periplasmic adaptor subunit [Ancylobacter crimeensis]MCK0197160.1 efflux RND transporter periplasmic adaptor subunit [Ancylobacter crimeensis]
MQGADRPGRGRGIVAAIALLAIAGGAIWVVKGRATPEPAPEKTATAKSVVVPVSVAKVERRDVAVTLSGIGTVQASQTVNIHSRIDGTLQSVTFTEGQQVKAGDVLARLDPRLAQATLAQARAAKAKDEALLASAQADLTRSLTLAKSDFASKQTVDQQQATVDQYKATIAADEAQIESAQTNLDYTTITAPVDGRMGMRQVDAGNVVHSSDTTPIAVLATLKPIAVVLTLPEKNLPAVQAALAAGPVPAVAKGGDGTVLGTGKLAVIDNQIDTSTGTLRLKAMFPNEKETLWPGAFVHVDLEVGTLKDALTVPVAAVQRGPDGLFAWVVGPEEVATMTPIETGTMSKGSAVVTSGLSDGQSVVTEGQYRLRPNSKVAVAGPGADTGATQKLAEREAAPPAP